MSILEFFKPLKKPLVTPSTNKALLDSKGLLTKVLSSPAINMVNLVVNDEVRRCTKTGSLPIESVSRKKYLTLTPAQRFKVGKTAAKHGTSGTVLLNYESSGFPASFALQFLSWSSVGPYQLILMVVPNHRYY